MRKVQKKTENLTTVREKEKKLFLSFNFFNRNKTNCMSSLELLRNILLLHQAFPLLSNNFFYFAQIK